MIYTDKIIKQRNNQKEKRRKIFKIISFPFVIIILLLVFYAGYMKYIKKENDINILGFRQYMVDTGSMEPQYSVGDLIIIKETPKEKIQVGDVINYTSENGIDTITHRVVEILEKDGEIYYKTKGDNNNEEDSDLVNFNQVQGVLVFKISKLGTIIKKMLTENGIIIILAFIILLYLRDEKKEEKRIARENARKIYKTNKNRI